MSDTAWRANLDWLRTHETQLSRLIFDVPSPGRLRLCEGQVQWMRGVQPTLVHEPDEAVREILDSVDPSQPVVLMGVGTGRLLRALLDHTSAPVTAWDRDPSFLRPALLAEDWTTELESGRLRFSRGADLLDAVGQRIAHPILGAAYLDEIEIAGHGAPRALLVHGTLFVADVGEALRDAGWDVLRWDVQDLPESELTRTARRFAPDVVFAINHTHGLAEACEALGVPLVEWEIDPATDRVRSTRAGSAKVFTWRHSQVDAYRDAGFEAHYLPLATNPRRRAPLELTPSELETYGVDVAYVGSSMVERGRSLHETFVSTFHKAYGDARAGAELAGQLLEVQARVADTKGYVLPALLDQVAPDITDRFLSAGCRHRPDALLGEIAAARYRLEVLARLGPKGLHVWGDPGWQALAPHGATYRGWAGHYQELTRIYSAAKVHIDVGRLYQLDIVPMRIFDVIAAGGFVLAQHSAALEQVLVPGLEVITWRTPDELADLVSYYLDHPEARARIAAAGRQRVLSEHTIAARLSHMLGDLRRTRQVA